MENTMDITQLWPTQLLYWRRMSSTAISEYLAETPVEKRLVIIVWGVLESHGPFLPLASDSHLAALAADALALRLQQEHGVRPIIFDGWKDVGSWSATRNFPGAIAFDSSKMPFIRHLWEQTLTRMAKEGFTRFFLVNGDGGNWMNHWYGIRWDSPAIDALIREHNLRLEGANWDQEGGAPYLHGGSHEHALTTWACKYAPSAIRLSALRHGLSAPGESWLHEIDGPNQAFLEDVPHRERDWSTYEGQDTRRSVTRFSLDEYRTLIYAEDGTPLEDAPIGRDFAAKIEYLTRRAAELVG